MLKKLLAVVYTVYLILFNLYYFCVKDYRQLSKTENES